MANRSKRSVKKRARNHRNTVKAGKKMRARRKSRGMGKKRKPRTLRRISANRG